MQYRSLPKHPDVGLSVLGFGCMRLPILNGDIKQIDEEAATRLVKKAIDAGVNYFDTAYPYHGGESEPFVGRALKGGLRERVYLATKLPTWAVKTEADWERFLDEQLKRLDTSVIDFYLLHGLSGERWETVSRLHGLAAMERARADGRIRFIGFSFHGSPDAFGTIVEGYDWDFTQIQYNFMDEEYQAGTAGLRRAAERRLGVIAMEPLRGGVLAAEGPEAVQRIWARAGDGRRPADRALRWVWNDAAITCALSGMNSEQQLGENVRSAEASQPGAMTPAELALVAEVREYYRSKMMVTCTTCGYCLPCPSGVAIPDVFSAYNTATMFEAKQSAAMVYRMWTMGSGHGADVCLQCGECEPKCPQQIPIAEKLDEAHRHLVG